MPRLGPKAFEQAAGFLRIMNGKNPLDASAVHPEAYPVVEKIAEATKRPLKAIIGDSAFLETLKPAAFADAHIRHPDRHRHHRRAGEARPRPAPRVQDRHLQGRHREDLAT